MIKSVTAYDEVVTYRGCKENMPQFTIGETKIYECYDDFCNGSVRRWVSMSLLFVSVIIVRYIA